VAGVRVKCSCGQVLSAEGASPGDVLRCDCCGRKFRLPQDRSAFSAETIADPTSEAGRGGQRHLVGRRLGQFEVKSLIGRGGMGEVYSAVDTGLDRRVALKVLSRELAGDKSFVLRFQREAKAAARLSHPNIVQIFSIGESDDLHFFAMEFIEGESIQDVLDHSGPMDPAEAARVVLEAAKGLRAAAAEGLVHRDVKPANLLRCKDGSIKVADFGLAKPSGADLSLTATGIVVGSPLYMSPEQGQAQEVDLRSDIYSLGATLYHMLAGAPPYDAPTAMAVMLKHISEPLPALDCPEPIARIAFRMMAKKPEERYGSYDELIADLEAFLKGCPPPASAPAPSAAAAERPAASAAADLHAAIRARVEREIQDSMRAALHGAPAGSPAGVAARAGAFLMDALAVLVFLRVAIAVFQNQVLAVGVFTAALAVVYVGSMCRWGGTPGKLLVGIRVETLAGARPGIDAATWRFFASWFLLFVPLAIAAAASPTRLVALQMVSLLVLLSLAAGILRRDKRALHDLIAGTRVVTSGGGPR